MPEVGEPVRQVRDWTKMLQAFSPMLIFVVAATVNAGDSSSQASRAEMTQTMYAGDRAAGFRSMDEVFQFRVIRRGGPIAALPRAIRKLNVSYIFEGTQSTLDGLLERTRTQGFLVIKNGAIVDERYFNGATETSKFSSWSVAKSFTSTLVGLALADGKIASLDDPVTRYLPELKGSAYEGPSIKNLLEMSSGVRFYENKQRC
jgi:CubicO group peptidase (beta-lactamase class C family)